MEHFAQAYAFMSDEFPHIHQNASSVNGSLNVQTVNFYHLI